jgi:hypothetical protein
MVYSCQGLMTSGFPKKPYPRISRIRQSLLNNNRKQKN